MDQRKFLTAQDAADLSRWVDARLRQFVLDSVPALHRWVNAPAERQAELLAAYRADVEIRYAALLAEIDTVSRAGDRRGLKRVGHPR